jgi:hypothetical protein
MSAKTGDSSAAASTPNKKDTDADGNGADSNGADNGSGANKDGKVSSAQATAAKLNNILLWVFVVFGMVVGLTALILSIIVYMDATPLAYLNCNSATGQAIPNNVQTTIQVRNILTQTGVSYNLATDQITVTYPGSYFISLSAHSNSATDVFSTWVRVNNLDSPYYGLNGLSSTLNLATPVQFQANDVFDIQTYQNSGSDLDIDAAGGRLTNLTVLLQHTV